MEHLNTSDLSGEERFEAEAAFGKDADLVRLEPEDLPEPTETRYPMVDALEEGDHVVIGSKRHDNEIASGTIEELTSYSMSLDLDPGSNGVGYYGFDGFGGERGTMFTLERVNGEDVDVEYGEVEVED